jgi:hypothetical protein
MLYSELTAKSGFRTGKLNAVKKELLLEGRIWQNIDDETGHRVIYIILADKRQQILDLIRDSYTGVRFRLNETDDFVERCYMTEKQVHDVFLQLEREGYLEVESMRVTPDQRLLDEITR